MASRMAVFAALCGVCAGGWSYAAEMTSPAGPEALQENCQRCHRLILPLERPKTCEAWRSTVARMSERRVRLRQEPIPEETERVLAEYLAAADAVSKPGR